MNAKISLYCPKMPITRVGFRLWRTAAEPMRATIVFSDGRPDVVVEPVTIEPTNVHVRPKMITFHTVQVAVVDACIGDSLTPYGNSVKVELPEESVVVDLTTGELIATKMSNCKTTVMLADGSVWNGMVEFPDSITDLFNGGAAAVTATGEVTKV